MRLRFVSIEKGNERYAFYFAPEQTCEVLLRLGRWAGNPELAFDWSDAAYVVRQIELTWGLSSVNPANSPAGMEAVGDGHLQERSGQSEEAKSGDKQ